MSGSADCALHLDPGTAEVWLIRQLAAPVTFTVRPGSVLAPLLVGAVVAGGGLAFRQDSQPMAAQMRTTAVAEGRSATIMISNYDYEPMKLTVRAGTRITVINRDQTAHTLTARSGAFDSGTVNPGQSRTFTASRPGVYTYYCQFHAFMSGTLTVVK